MDIFFITMLGSLIFKTASFLIKLSQSFLQSEFIPLLGEGISQNGHISEMPTFTGL